MTAPTTSGGTRSWLRPRVALPIIAGAVIVVALLTPEQTGGRSGDPRLSSRSTQSMGASVLYELAGRLGWRTSQRLTDSIPLGDTTSVQLILDPAIPPTAMVAHEVLDRVRRGGALFYIGESGALADSLGLGVRRRPGSVIGAAEMIVSRTGQLVATDTASCPKSEGFLRAGLPYWQDGKTYIRSVRWIDAQPDGAVPLATIRPLAPAPGRAAEELAAIVGFPFGNGRVVVAVDPDLLRNDVLRVCRWGADVAAARALDYLSAGAVGGGRREQFVFDEYHQGYGDHPGTLSGIVRYLGKTPSGHLVLQIAGAGLVLLLAVGPRLLPPRASERIERRSPLEHVDALAQAYRAVGATRTATSRLVHGVRRRVEHSLGSRAGVTTDESFLAWAEVRAPTRAADVALVRQALAKPISRRDFELVGQALGRLETALTSFPLVS